MGFILICILCSTGILIVFKQVSLNNSKVLPVIIVNYIVASFLGFALYWRHSDSGYGFGFGSIAWWPFAAAIGILFIVLFFVVARSTVVSGMGITSIATKMSVIFPVLYSMLFFSEQLTLIKLTGIVLAFAALFIGL